MFKNYVKIISILVCFVIFLSACNNTSQYTQSQSNEPISQPQTVYESTVSAENPDNLSQLMNGCGKTVTVYGELNASRYSDAISELQTVLDSYSRNISLAVYSLNSDRALAYNTETAIFGACTVKAAYALYACRQMENGNGSLGDELTYLEKHYESGTGDMQYSPFGTVFTVETALYKTMSISDNVGYRMIVDYFGTEGYNKFISELGCDSLQIKPTVWSLHTRSNDLVRLWRCIYDYFETDTEYSRFLYKSCTNTACNYATSSPDGAEYSHKQGSNSKGDWLSYSDAGIVWKDGSPYIMALLTDAPGPSGYDNGVFDQIIDIVYNRLF